MEYWSYSIADLGLLIAEFKYDVIRILIVSIRNLKSEIT